MIEQQSVVNRRYRIDRPVGDGGMAVVYRGHDLLLGRDVAVKVLRPQYASDPNVRARFEREAQAAAGFAHPNIIDIYDVGEEDGTPYIVMEFVRGQTLKEIIGAEGPFHPDDVAALLDQLCSALDYAHERGYVHRDVKPQNILVDARGHARVVDFGIAKGLADADLTEIGAGLGTVGYLSPEQASGLMATPASDVYSAGVVAFEMLTRRLPFEADTPVGVAMRHVHDPPPPPSSLRPPIPPAVDALVLRAMAKDPTQRFPTAGAFARAMRDWRSVEAATAPVSATAAAAPTAVLPAAQDDAGWDRPPPRPGPRSSRPGPGLASPVGGTPSAVPQVPAKDDVGCATWATGTLILIGLVALVWIGFRLSPRLAQFGAPPTPPPGEEIVIGAQPEDPPAGGLQEQPPAAPAGPTAAPTTAPPALATVAPTPTPAAPAVVAVPELVGLPLPDAEAAANALGLTVAVGDPVADETVPPDLVARQDPPPATEIEQGGTVAVSLSRGSDRIDLAALDLVGLPAADAEARLRQAGLAVATEQVGSQTVGAGLVAGVAPANRVRPGETVTLRVSRGDAVFLPGEIQGQPLDQVARQIERSGLRPGSRHGVAARSIEDQGVDLLAAGIDDGDVVGVTGRAADGGDVTFDVWLPRGTRVDLVYYDATLDREG